MSYEQIRYEVSEGILTLTLHRPDKLNAFTATMAKEVIDAFDAADADDDGRDVVVTGAGRAFCAGADLSAGGDTFDPRVRGGTREDALRDGGARVSLRTYQAMPPLLGAF